MPVFERTNSKFEEDIVPLRIRSQKLTWKRPRWINCWSSRRAMLVDIPTAWEMVKPRPKTESSKYLLSEWAKVPPQERDFELQQRLSIQPDRGIHWWKNELSMVRPTSASLNYLAE